MKVEVNKNETIITIPNDIDISGIERFINFIKYKESTKNSTTPQPIVDKLAKEFNKSIWQEYKKTRNIQ